MRVPALDGRSRSNAGCVSSRPVVPRVGRVGVAAVGAGVGDPRSPAGKTHTTSVTSADWFDAGIVRCRPPTIPLAAMPQSLGAPVAGHPLAGYLPSRRPPTGPPGRLILSISPPSPLARPSVLGPLFGSRPTFASGSLSVNRPVGPPHLLSAVSLARCVPCHCRELLRHDFRPPPRHPGRHSRRGPRRPCRRYGLGPARS